MTLNDPPVPDPAVHAALRETLGAYVLGALSPAQRRDLDAHLETCQACRAELSELLVVPLLLRHATPPATAAAAGSPATAGEPQWSALLAASRAAGRRRTRRRTAGAALTAISAVAAATVILLTTSSPGATMERPVTLARGPVTGTAAVGERAWGTTIHLRLAHLPEQGTFTLEAIDGRGHTEVAAHWAGTSRGTADLDGATSIPRSDLTSLAVLGRNGGVIARTNV